MTKLIVTPIDPAAPGSYKKNKRLRRALKLARQAQKSSEADATDAMLEVYDLIENLVLENLETDDGTPVDDALDEISEQDFMSLLQALLGAEKEGDDATVPPPMSAS